MKTLQNDSVESLYGNPDTLTRTGLAKANRSRTNWKRVLDRRLPDLRVLYSASKPIGFVYKLADTSTGKSQWCCNVGVGDSAKLVGHRWTLEQAKLNVEETMHNGEASHLNKVVSNTATL